MTTYPWTKTIFRIRCGAWRTYIGGRLYSSRTGVMAGPKGRLP